MPAQRLPMRQVREVLRLKHTCGQSDRLIAAAIGVSRYTVAEYLRRAAVVGIAWPVPAGLDDAALQARLFSPPFTPQEALRPQPDWGRVHAELRRPGVTLLLLWQEYRAEQAMAALAELTTGTARVVRDGSIVGVPTPEVVPGDLVEMQAFVVQNNIGGRAGSACSQRARSGIDTKLLEKLVTSESYRKVPSNVLGRPPEEGLLSLDRCGQMGRQLQESISGLLACGSVFEPLHRVFHVSRQRVVFQKRFHALWVW